MAEQRVEVPDIGDAEDVDVVEVLVKPGMKVEANQGLIVLESDKASMEVPSPSAGTIKEVALKTGDKVSKGALILVLESDGAGEEKQPDAKQPGAKQPEAKQPEAKRAAAPKPAPATAAKAPQQEPDPTPADDVDPDAEPESASDTEPPERDTDSDTDSDSDSDADSDAATAVLPAPPRVPKADAARTASDRDGPTRTVPPPAYPSLAAEPAPARDSVAHAAPAVRQLARELGVDLKHVKGSGPHGRVTKEDVQRYVKHAMSAAGTATGAGFAVPELPEIDFSQFGEVGTEPLTKIQKLSGRNLLRSWVTIPHVTQFDEADITELEEFRKKMRADRPEVKLTLTSFFMKAVVVVLKQMPRFNSSLDRSGENLIMKQYFHIGVAVDTPNGLVVPVIRNVDVKGLHDLAIELSEVSEKARARRLSPADLQGASITISSLGGIGGTHFTPIINPPEVAVLGVSRAAIKPAYVGDDFDKIEPRLMCGLSLSYDHRVIDGAYGVRFTNRLREVLADIREMLL
ncbi:MAG TPA: 2-oxo acid dehydrogenase subunit E2 [Polyangiales bacterium]|nr:2-oxo acid dehydrogenase subunit E2 [Polyangiales bacterium]